MTLDPAPARGRYDRSQSPQERASEQRRRLIEATAHVVATGSASVHAISAVSQTGRNTFYAHFRDVTQATDAVVTSVVERLHAEAESALARAVTPLETIRAIVSAWLDALGADIVLARGAFAAAAAERRGGLSRIGTQLRNHLRRAAAEARRHGALSTPADELRLLAAAAACEALLAWYVDHPDSREDVRELGADLLVRALR